MHMISSTTAILAGSDSYVAKTIDGGSTFTTQDVYNDASGATYTVNDNLVFMLDSNSAFVMGCIDGTSTCNLYYTANGGTSWALDQGDFTDMTSMSFYDASNGVLGGIFTGSFNQYAGKKCFYCFIYLFFIVICMYFGSFLTYCRLVCNHHYSTYQSAIYCSKYDTI